MNTIDLPVLVSRRKVSRVRLRLSTKGLLVIVPTNFKGGVEEIIVRNKAWIDKQASKMWQMQQQVKHLPQYDRSLVELETIVDSYVAQGKTLLTKGPVAIKYRVMKTRWGSCSDTGNITFNKKLRFLPDELIRYVVFHELIHLFHHNHSKDFWQMLSEFVPDYKRHKNQLKLYGLLLEQSN